MGAQKTKVKLAEALCELDRLRMKCAGLEHEKTVLFNALGSEQSIACAYKRNLDEAKAEVFACRRERAEALRELGRVVETAECPEGMKPAEHVAAALARGLRLRDAVYSCASTAPFTEVYRRLMAAVNDYDGKASEAPPRQVAAGTSLDTVVRSAFIAYAEYPAEPTEAIVKRVANKLAALAVMAKADEAEFEVGDVWRCEDGQEFKVHTLLGSGDCVASTKYGCYTSDVLLHDVAGLRLVERDGKSWTGGQS